MVIQGMVQFAIKPQQETSYLFIHKDLVCSGIKTAKCNLLPIIIHPYNTTIGKGNYIRTHSTAVQILW